MRISGHTLRLMRMSADLKSRELAAMCEISPSYLAMIEGGSRPITPRVKRRIEQIFGIFDIA